MLSRPLPDRRSTARHEAAAAYEPELLTTLLFFSLSHARISRDAAPSRRDIDHWEFAKGRGHLFATRMSFIVQIFSLLYSYRYIVTLRNIDCDGGHYYVAVPLLYFLIFLLNKCDDAENINMRLILLLHHAALPRPNSPPLFRPFLVLSHLFRYVMEKF